MIRRIKNRSQEGQATIEFALSAVFLVMLIVGCVEIVVMVYTYTVLADAAKEGVRYAIVHGTGVGAANCSGPGNASVTCTDSTGANVKAAVTNYAALSFHTIGSGSVGVSYPDSHSEAPDRVQVTVTYSYQPLFVPGCPGGTSWLCWPSITVNASSEGRIAF